MYYTKTENGLWGQVLVYDIAAIPEGATLEQIMHLYNEHGVVIYDSERVNGDVLPPFIVNPVQRIQIQNTRDEYI